MSDRVVAVLARASGSLPTGLAAAMLEDVVDLVTESPMVTAVLAVAAGSDVATETLTWPGTRVVAVAADPRVADVLAAIASPAAAAAAVSAVAVVVADAPDLPTLLLGKLFSALAGPRGAAVAVCPAQGGGLVAVAATLPVVDWLARSTLRLDDPYALGLVRRAAPDRQLSICPGWRRVREQADAVHLDPGLEGWDATRAFLSPHSPM